MIMGLFSGKQDFLKEFTIGVSIISFGSTRRDAARMSGDAPASTKEGK
jgi:hypothetical protein